MNEKLEQENRSKYGQKTDDLIARTYRDNHSDGDMWCYLNVTKYLGRYVRKGSAKAGIHENLLKARDYLDRMIEANEHVEKKATMPESVKKTKKEIEWKYKR